MKNGKSMNKFGKNGAKGGGTVKMKGGLSVTTPTSAMCNKKGMK